MMVVAYVIAAVHTTFNNERGLRTAEGVEDSIL